MPRYLFHTEDGGLMKDEEGFELISYEAAKVEAVRLMGGMMSDQPQEFWGVRGLRVMVTDDHNALLFGLSLFAIEAP